MRIRALELEGFRSYRERFRVAGLADGLNVIAGSNEEGKSTLLRAIKAAVFDRHGSAVGEEFRPYDHDVSPRVRLEFELDGVRWNLVKVFSRRKDGGTWLEAKGGAWRDAAAEEKMAELLGFDYAQRGGTRAELQGVAGVLWVEQGEAHAPLQLNERARSSFEAVFDHELTELLGGHAGGQLLARVAARRSELLTETGRPRGRYRELREEVDGLAGDLAGAREELADYEQQVRELDHLAGRLAELDADDALAVSRRAVEDAQKALERVEGLAGELEAAKAGLRVRTLEAEAARRAWKTREALAGGLDAVRRRIREAEAREEAARQALAPLRRRLEGVRAALGEARRRRDALAEQVAGTRLAGELARARERLAADRRRLAEAQTAEEALRALEARVAATAVTDEVLQTLRDSERAAERAQERLDAVATRLHFDLRAGARVRLDGEALDGHGQRRLTRPARIEVDGGTLTILPGAADLEDLHARLEEARARLRRALGAAGVDSVEAALAAHHERRIAEGEAAKRQAILEALAPDGLAASEATVRRRELEAEALAARAGDVAGEERPLEQLETELAEHSQRVADLDAQREADEEADRSHAEVLADRRQAVQAARRELSETEAELERARRDASDVALKAAAEAAEEALAEAMTKVDGLTRALASRDPEAMRLELQRRREVAGRLADERSELERRARDLEIRLAALGQRGLAERVASLEVRRADRQRELDLLQRRAEALELLHGTLAQHLSEAREALLAPVSGRMVPYLRQLMPEATPILDEHFGLAGLRRRETEEPFESLSIGTREQIAVLMRLAYADLLADKGLPASVILDDALVNSDDARRETMKRLLYQAGRRHQLILMTCHAREWRDAGGHFVRLEDLRAARGFSPE